MPADLDLAALKALADKATPGPWIMCEIERRIHCGVVQELRVMVDSTPRGICDMRTGIGNEGAAIACADAAYIAALSPEVVKRLIARTRRAEAALLGADDKFKALGQCVTTGEMLDIMADGRELCMAALAGITDTPKEVAPSPVEITLDGLLRVERNKALEEAAEVVENRAGVDAYADDNRPCLSCCELNANAIRALTRTQPVESGDSQPEG